MIVGVNGTGKTTTIGKIAWHLQKELGLDVIVAAADTYRAAAVNQLAEWADRAGTQIVRGTEGGDPGAVAFDARCRGRGSRRRRRDLRHGRPPPHPRQPDGGAGQGAPGDRQADSRTPRRRR